MSERMDSTRRSFLKNGAVLAAPLAAAVPSAVIADDGLKARLARLEDERAIRELHHAWLRDINAHDAQAGIHFDENVRGIAADHAAEPDAIEVASDGKKARGRYHCSVATADAIVEDSTIAQMAREQGGGFILRTERRVLRVEYVKMGGAWSVAKAEFSDA